MIAKARFARGFSRLLAILSLSVLMIAAALLFFGGNLRRSIREYVMQRATSAHYEILCTRGALSQSAMTEFATQREPLFTVLNKKLRNADSTVQLRVIFDSNFPGPPGGETGLESYSVNGRTIRTKLKGPVPQLPDAADAEALIYAAWGKPGSAQLARWTAIWFVGGWRGQEIGMAAAQVEQKLGHKKLASLLGNPGTEISSPSDLALLGAAWIGEIAEFGGPDAVRKLYAAKMPRSNIDDVAKALGTTPLELDRKWQLWMYAYLAGMPSMPHDSTKPMDMPMAGSNSVTRDR